MTIHGSFAAIQTAILGQSQSFRVIANDIANQNSPGSKRSKLHFQTIINERFGQNDGHGISTYQRQNIDEQGIFLSSSRNEDIAIDGPGFFITRDPLTPADNFRLTRNGGFRPFFQLGGPRDTNGSTFLSDGDQHYLQGWVSDDEFNIPDVKNLNNIGNINVDLLQRADSGQQTNQAFLSLNLPVNSSITTDIPTYSIDVIDSQSTARQFVLSFQPQTAFNQWNIEVTSVAETGATPAPVGNFPLAFDNNGRRTTPSTLNLVTTWPGGAVSDVELNIPDITSFSGNFLVHDFDHDGREAGNLLDYFIDQEGIIRGRYSNGEELFLGQIAIADVINRDRLQAINGTKFRLSELNGSIELYDLTQTNRARIQANALESSTVDIADSFSSLIETQHAYSVAAQNLQTINENLRTAINMKS